MSEQSSGSYGDSSDEPQAVVTPYALVIPFTEEHRRQAKECLERSGSIKISFKEISATSLTDVVDLAPIIID
jgi:hypothetical protein